MKTSLIAQAALALAGCATANKVELSPEMAARCAKEDCYIVPQSQLAKSAEQLYQKGVEDGKKWL